MAASTLVLASRSPRRAELLRVLGVRFRVVDVAVDETQQDDEDPRHYVIRLARTKAAAGRACTGGETVLAADTSVVLDLQILGKPRDPADAANMLRRLSGCWHEVFTGVALAGETEETLCVATRVRFRPLTAIDIERYCASGEPFDKAGGYGIQGLGGAFVDRIEGSYSNVVGLPLSETVYLLDRARIRHHLSPGRLIKPPANSMR
ncbi:MAG: Maf family protein [Gammaproteobacteria bacterium]